MTKLLLFSLLSIISVYVPAGPLAVNAVPVEQSGEPARSSPPVALTPALDLSAFSTVERIIPALADKRVVFVGEQHTRYDHHLTQLEIIRRLHALHPQLAIGMEAFQQPFQNALDEFLAGTISEQAMLRATEYYQRWRLDYRHYAPILRYAREHGLPVIALNVPTELTRAVGRVGLEGLNDAQRRQLPDDIAAADEAYRRRVKTVFDFHPNDKGQRFEHFLEAQLLWDEGMAERAATYLQEHPHRHLVVIAGNQHLAWGSAIPERLQRRVEVTAASILNSWDGVVKPGLADFLLLPAERALPPAGKMGALLEDNHDRVIIASCVEDGACAAAGIKAGDRITAIDDTTINNTADLRLALWDKQPGDTISISILRKRLLRPAKDLSYQLTLK